MKFKLFLHILILSFVASQCKQDKNASKANAMTTADTEVASKDNKMTPGQIGEEKDQLLGWLKNRKDLVHFNQLLNQSSSILPLLYDDNRLKVNFFVPNDMAYQKLDKSQFDKLNDNIPDDFELKMLNQLIVKTTDFSWKGATAIGGMTVKFGDTAGTVVIGEKTHNILETVMLSARSRAYIIDQLP
ncbi:MAG: hypothetical protein IPO62_05110 [Saprospiraceae bacterium]|nr:hypothetical protein [Saprospiraceae bacterium]